MGGSYKKKLRAEKAKVKLKGVKLPKSLNVTKTEFKVRKITIKDHLKANQCVKGYKLFNLKEELLRLKHHNYNFRLEAVRNLRTAINLKCVDVTIKLSDVVQGVTALCLDVERDVRSESIKTLNALLEYRELSITPFFHIISSYLRCAMTHIQPSIQQDSLKILDVLLQHVPHLVTTQSNKIFKNFLEMISTIRADDNKEERRLLTINISNNQTTIKWRSKVLHRLQNMFATLVQYKQQEQYARENHLLKQKGQIFITFNTKTPQYYGIIFRSSCHNENETINNRSVLNSSVDLFTSMNNVSNEIHNYIMHLMPLLQESWLEVKPQLHTTTTIREGTVETLLSTDAVESLSIILDIIEKLWSLVDIEEKIDKTHNLALWFQNNYCELFELNFMSKFYPYQTLQQEKPHLAGRKHMKTQDRENLLQDENKLQYKTIDCTQENILIAYLLCRFKDERLTGDDQTQIHCIVKYLTNIILKPIPLLCWKPLLKVLKELLLIRGRQMLKFQFVYMRNLMVNVIKLYLERNFRLTHDSQISTHLLLILCGILQDNELSQTYNIDDLFNDFLSYLPQLLLKTNIQEQSLLALTQLAKRQSPQFLNSLSLHIESVMENLPNIEIVGCVNVFEGKKLIINLFYWCKLKKTLTLDKLKGILHNVDTKVTDKRINSYCHYVFNLE